MTCWNLRDRRSRYIGSEISLVLAETETDVPDGVEVLYVSESVMETVSTQKTPQSLCAAVKTPGTVCPDSFPRGMIIALDCLQDPGNLGTIIRTADAFGAAGVLLSRDSADPFSPKSLRAAMGSTYHLPIWIGDLPKELLKLKKQGFSCICGHLRGSEKFPLHGADTVLVIGNEGNGVSDAVASLCEQYPDRSHLPVPSHFFRIVFRWFCCN